MSGKIAIVDYQMGNLRSVQKALEAVGAQVTVTSNPEELIAADKIVLPGVGAFGDAMRELSARELVEPIREWVQRDRPFLGICLGLQLLFDVGDEGGEHAGLGIFPGRVCRFQLPREFKVPHMGWNQTSRRRVTQLDHDQPDNTYYYYVHSYYVRPVDERLIWLEADYGGPFCAAIHRGNLFATQFHPEKSQRDGLKLLEGFVQL
jgi:imidazole glycerol-phosphate synthase subunit HisH